MKEKIKLEKKFQQKNAVIEHREPIVSVLEEKGVKAAYMESQKRKRIEDEELQQAKKSQNCTGIIKIADFWKYKLLSMFLLLYF